MRKVACFYLAVTGSEILLFLRRPSSVSLPPQNVSRRSLQSECARERCRSFGGLERRFPRGAAPPRGVFNSVPSVKMSSVGFYSQMGDSTASDREYPRPMSAQSSADGRGAEGAAAGINCHITLTFWALLLVRRGLLRDALHQGVDRQHNEEINGCAN